MTLHLFRALRPYFPQFSFIFLEVKLGLEVSQRSYSNDYWFCYIDNWMLFALSWLFIINR